MPNWCEGTLKVRGKQKNLIRFVLEGLSPVGILGEAHERLKLDECCCIYSNETCHIENTRRGFVEGLCVEFCDEDEDERVICLDSYFARGISAKELQKTCIKYNVDMKIYAFERGMEFNQDIEIVGGEIVRDVEIVFKGKDYNWDCICPNMGG